MFISTPLQDTELGNYFFMNLCNTKNQKYPIKSYLFVCPSVITYFKGIVGISLSSSVFTSSFDLLLIEKFTHLLGGFFYRLVNS